MTLNSRNADAVRRLMQSGGDLSAVLKPVTGFTLAGLVELVATTASMGAFGDAEVKIESIAETRGGILRLALSGWNSATDDALHEDIHGVRPAEFFRIRRREDHTGLPYQLYQERFVRSLKHAEFPTKFSEALAGALFEMTDNIVQHSLREPGEFSGLAGYHAAPGYMAFAVMDIGQGVYSSLTRSPIWKDLPSAQEALRAAVCQQASSRPDQPEGEGFRTVFKSLSDRNCRLRFRSDDVALVIEDGGTQRNGSVVSSPHLAGLQLSVCCALSGRPEEKAINGA